MKMSNMLFFYKGLNKKDKVPHSGLKSSQRFCDVLLHCFLCQFCQELIFFCSKKRNLNNCFLLQFENYERLVILVIEQKFSLKMEACLSVEREVNKVLDKFLSLQTTNGKVLAEVQNLLRSAKNELQCDDGENSIL